MFNSAHLEVGLVGVDSNDVGGFAELVGFGRDSFRGQGGSGS